MRQREGERERGREGERERGTDDRLGIDNRSGTTQRRRGMKRSGLGFRETFRFTETQRNEEERRRGTGAGVAGAEMLNCTRA